MIIVESNSSSEVEGRCTKGEDSSGSVSTEGIASSVRTELTPPTDLDWDIESEGLSDCGVFFLMIRFLIRGQEGRV